MKAIFVTGDWTTADKKYFTKLNQAWLAACFFESRRMLVTIVVAAVFGIMLKTTPILKNLKHPL